MVTRKGVVSRTLSLEVFEARCLMAGLPYGAQPDDTGEFFLGRVAVTPVLIESNGQIDSSTENWTQPQINQILSNLDQGLDWWVDLLATKTTIHDLEFVLDTQFATTPSPSAYEPITRVSNDYAFWVSEFLTREGFSDSINLEDNMRAFNHSQRQKLSADWSFTVFVVNSQNDSDGSFAAGGSFSRAFAFAGGLFFVIPSTRPASTYAHETGHMFWARDEYVGGGNYYQRRGYYNTQNLNAIDLNPAVNFVQSTSIMSAGSVLQSAYDQLISPASTLAMLGWQDSDGDQIFDVLDVPLILDGVGRFDSTTGDYRFRGSAKVDTLPNINSSGLQNDITLNRVSRIEYRINNGNWTTIVQPGTYEANLNLTIPLLGVTSGTIQIRAADADTGILSNVFTGSIGDRSDTVETVGINGWIWWDDDLDSHWDSSEGNLANWTARLVSAGGQPITLQQSIEPDTQTSGSLPSNAFPGVTLSSVGIDADGRLGVFADTSATTGTMIFRPFSVTTRTFLQGWKGNDHQLRVDFSTNTSFVSVDVIGNSSASYGRLELYNAAGQILDRITSKAMGIGQVQTLKLGRDQGDIAYAIIRGHANSSIKIDNLRYGPESETRVDSNGRYSLRYLPAGQYTVEVVPPSSSFQFTNTVDGRQSVTLGAGTTLSHVDFGAEFTGSAWTNPRLNVDTNADNSVTPLDALLVINRLNVQGSLALSGSNIPTTPYIDVTSDGELTPLDALIVINYLNANGISGEGELPGNGESGNGQPAPSEGESNQDSNSLIEINAVENRYTGEVGPALADSEFMERLRSPSWNLPMPCNCAYCLSMQDEEDRLV